METFQALTLDELLLNSLDKEVQASVTVTFLLILVRPLSSRLIITFGKESVRVEAIGRLRGLYFYDTTSTLDTHVNTHSFLGYLIYFGFEKWVDAGQ